MVPSNSQTWAERCATKYNGIGRTFINQYLLNLTICFSFFLKILFFCFFSYSFIALMMNMQRTQGSSSAIRTPSMPRLTRQPVSVPPPPALPLLPPLQSPIPQSPTHQHPPPAPPPNPLPLPLSSVISRPGMIQPFYSLLSSFSRTKLSSYPTPTLSLHLSFTSPSHRVLSSNI